MGCKGICSPVRPAGSTCLSLSARALPSSAWVSSRGSSAAIQGTWLLDPSCHSGEKASSRGVWHSLGFLTSWMETAPSVPTATREGGDLQGEPGTLHLCSLSPHFGGEAPSKAASPSCLHLPTFPPTPKLPPPVPSSPHPLLPSHNLGIPPWSGCLKELPGSRAGPQNKRNKPKQLASTEKGKSHKKSGLPLSTNNGHSLVLRTVFFASPFQQTFLSPSSHSRGKYMCVCIHVPGFMSHTNTHTHPMAEGRQIQVCPQATCGCGHSPWGEGSC